MIQTHDLVQDEKGESLAIRNPESSNMNPFTVLILG